MWRRPLIGLLALVLLVTQVADTLVVALSLASFGSAPPGARGTGHDAQWLGHAWVDGRKDQSDVDSLVTGLRDTGIRDLFGPHRTVQRRRYVGSRTATAGALVR